jgi:hypothetical protein
MSLINISSIYFKKKLHPHPIPICNDPLVSQYPKQFLVFSKADPEE